MFPYYLRFENRGNPRPWTCHRLLAVARFTRYHLQSRSLGGSLNGPHLLLPLLAVVFLVPLLSGFVGLSGMKIGMMMMMMMMMMMWVMSMRMTMTMRIEVMMMMMMMMMMMPRSRSPGVVGPGPLP